MAGKIIGLVILGLITAFCFYTSWLSHAGQDSQGFWMFLAFGMLFFIPWLLIIFNIISQRSKKFKQVYDKMTGAAEPQSARFTPHWFMMAAMGILFLCLASFIFNIIASFFRK